MKLTTLLLMMGIMQLSASVFSQQTNINLKMKNVSVEKAIDAIEELSKYDFFFSEKEVKLEKKISFNFSNPTLKEIVSKIFGENFKYQTVKNIVLVSPKSTNSDQKNKIKGIIKDKKGNPLPGVTILIKGTKVGVSSNVKGEFTINGKINDILIFSFIGMETKEVKYLGKELKVELEEKTANLDEIVITGYQVIEKRKLTSSVTTVKGKDVIEPMATSIDKMLQGKISGMTVMQQTSTPGAAPKIRIRGSSSITGNREPVWVVDGIILQDPVPLKTADLNSMDKVNLIGNAISFLNPQDIERIDILKDASATAIYGVKAANGVIVITTKKGKAGKTRLNYSASVGFTARPTYSGMERMNSVDRIEVSKEMHDRGLNFSSQYPSRVGYEGAIMDLWERNITYDQFNSIVKNLENNNTDWYKELFRNAISQNHNISISGGSGKTTYYFSAGYNNQKGATIGVDYTSLTTRLNIITELKKNLKLNISLSTGSTKNKRHHNSIDLYEYAYSTSRTIPAYNEDGSRYFYSNYEGYYDPQTGVRTEDIKYNIFHEMDNSGNQVKNKNVAVNLNLDWKINSMFSYKLTANMTNSNSYNEQWFSGDSYKAQVSRGLAYGVEDLEDNEDNSMFYRNNMLPAGGELSTQDMNSKSYVIRNSLRFNKALERHSFTSNLGFEINSHKSSGRNRTDYGYLPARGKTFVQIDAKKYQEFYELLMQNHTRVTDNENRFISFYGTFSYAFDHRYILNFNIRADGSNKFGQDESTKFLPVWSISGRWNIAEEKFLDNQNFLNQLSLRASYGIQGNVSPDQVPSLILRTGSLDRIANQYASTILKVPNDRLKWEKTKSYNLGLDFSILSNRINGSFEVYKKTGEDQIVNRDISPTNGASRVSLNAGTLENSGWELTLGATIIKAKDFSWSLSVNTSKNYNKISYAGISEELINSWGRVDTYKNYLSGDLIKSGNAVNSFYSYKFDKLDENGYPVFKDYNEKDADGNMLVNSPEEAYNRIFAFSGNRIPDLTGGFSTNITYKRLALNAQFSFSVGSKMRLNNLFNSYNPLPYPQENMSSEFINRWRKPGDEKLTNIPTLSNKDFSQELREREYRIGDNIWQMYNDSDLRVVKGDFLRCRNISLAYALNENFSKKIGLQGLNLSLSVSNLFVIKDSKLKGRDPEQIGMGSGTLPPQKTYSFTLSANF